MKNILKYHLFIFIAFLCFRSIAQENVLVDSLYNELKTTKENISKADLLNRLAKETKRENPDTSVYFSKQALALSEKLNYEKGVADARLNYAVTIINFGRYSEAVLELNKAAEYYRKALNNKTGNSEIKKQLAGAYNNIGLANDYQGNYPEALRNHFLALKLREELGDKKGISSTYNNIGIVYYYQKNYALALKNNLMALKIKTEINDKRGIANSYMNIGNVYGAEGNAEKALENYTLSLKIWEDLGDKEGVSGIYNNMAEILRKKGDGDRALEMHFASLKIKEEMNDLEGLASSYVNIGIIFLNQKKTNEAYEHFKKGLEIAKKIGIKNVIMECYGGLATIDSIRGDFKNTLENYKLNILYRDSLISEENTRKTLQTAMDYEFQKKEAVIKEQQEKERAVAAEKNHFQQIVIWSVVLGLLLVASFAGFVIRTLRATRFQKHIIEEKQREILDSIHYAKRIQKSLLPTEKYIEKSLHRLKQ